MVLRLVGTVPRFHGAAEPWNERFVCGSRAPVDLIPGASGL